MTFDPAAMLKSLESDHIEALIDTMVLAADADGEIADEERDELAERIQSLAKGTPHEGTLERPAIDEKIVATHGRIAGDERDTVLEEVKARLPAGDPRKAALGLAIAVTAADGIIRTSEREIIFELAEALEVDRDEAADLVIAIGKR